MGAYCLPARGKKIYYPFVNHKQCLFLRRVFLARSQPRHFLVSDSFGVILYIYFINNATQWASHLWASSSSSSLRYFFHKGKQVSQILVLLLQHPRLTCPSIGAAEVLMDFFWTHLSAKDPIRKGQEIVSTTQQLRICSSTTICCSDEWIQEHMKQKREIYKPSIFLYFFKKEKELYIYICIFV